MFSDCSGSALCSGTYTCASSRVRCPVTAQASIQQVRGSVSVLLDAALCAMCAALASTDRLLPAACLGPRDEQLLEPERAAALLDHVALLMPAV